MYAIHTTPGFIIGSQPRGEAGKMLSIFTRDLGSVLASAQGIRLEKSKLRYASQNYSFGEYSFVRGKDFWRLVDARNFVNISSSSPRRNVFVLLLPRSARDTQKSTSVAGSTVEMFTKFIARIALLLRRFLHGEEAHPELFDCVIECARFIDGEADLTNERLETLESLIVARILHRLGYIGDDKELNGHLRAIEITNELLDGLKNKRTVLNRHINKALKESHL